MVTVITNLINIILTRNVRETMMNKNMKHEVYEVHGTWRDVVGGNTDDLTKTEGKQSLCVGKVGTYGETAD